MYLAKVHYTWKEYIIVKNGKSARKQTAQENCKCHSPVTVLNYSKKGKKALLHPGMVRPIVLLVWTILISLLFYCILQGFLFERKASL